MRTLALDLGSKTGWCLDVGGKLYAGTKRLVPVKTLKASKSTRHDRRCDPRIPALYDFVTDTVENHNIQNVVFEDVLFASTRMQVQLWASLRAAVWLAATHQKCLVECLNTTALKKFATGGGNASKERMKSVLEREDFSVDLCGADDNMIDAVWLWKWANKHIKL